MELKRNDEAAAFDWREAHIRATGTVAALYGREFLEDELYARLSLARTNVSKANARFLEAQQHVTEFQRCLTSMREADLASRKKQAHALTNCVHTSIRTAHRHDLKNTHMHDQIERRQMKRKAKQQMQALILKLRVRFVTRTHTHMYTLTHPHTHTNTTPSPPDIQAHIHADAPEQQRRLAGGHYQNQQRRLAGHYRNQQ